MRPPSRSRRWISLSLDIAARSEVGRAELERAMWPLGVVVLDVDAEHSLGVAAVENKQPVETV
jgi:hypothetical protein